jgi:pantoate--beta-alanine ligase
MRTISSPKTFQATMQKLRRSGQTIGFVPTMGALHDGHRSLLRKARKENRIVALSIFVNPTQFGPKEDFRKYPRTLKSDLQMAQDERVDFVFTPSPSAIYPGKFLSSVHVQKLDDTLCGNLRPRHFTGVTTVVAKLLNITLPDVIYLGQKDAQQAIILKKMIADLNFPVTVRICPTVRMKDGLALSSRNAYLSPSERNEANILYRSLKLAKTKILTGERHASKIQSMIRREIVQHSSGIVEYAVCVHAGTLQEMKTLRGTVLVALAVRFGKTRLIDNMIIQLP